MSFKLVLVLIALAGVVGIAVGYFLRWLVSLGQKGSVELEIKQMMLEAKEEAKNVLDVAQEKANTLEAELRETLKEKENVFLAKDRRMEEKEGYLDRRQVDLDEEAARIKEQIREVKTLKERAEALVIDREKALEKAAQMTESEAQEALFESFRKNHEEDILVRLQKLDIDGKERLWAEGRGNLN